MLQEKYLPKADVIKVESIQVNAPIDVVYPIVEVLNFEKSKVIYWLFKLRGIPVPDSMSLKGLEKINFIKLEALRNQEIILGLIGKFWTPTGRLIRFDPDEFTSIENPNCAKATWSFDLTQIDASTKKLRTETRVHCPTQETKKRFKRYWTFIQPFSTWTRREILNAIKKQAENS